MLKVKKGYSKTSLALALRSNITLGVSILFYSQLPFINIEQKYVLLNK